MQNLLVLLFPLLIDGLNSVAGLDNPRVKFWVAIITSLVGGILLNLPMVEQVALHPDINNATALFTLLGLVVAATQGVYVKYWEDHSVRAKVFPTVTQTPSVSPAEITPAVEAAVNEVAS